MKAGRDSGAEARVWAVAELLRRQIADGATRVAVTSTSMGPLARRGDAFVFEPPGVRGARFGDVVLAVAGGRAVTHRVVGRRGGISFIASFAPATNPEPRGKSFARSGLRCSAAPQQALASARAAAAATHLSASAARVSFFRGVFMGFSPQVVTLLRVSFFRALCPVL